MAAVNTTWVDPTSATLDKATGAIINEAMTDGWSSNFDALGGVSGRLVTGLRREWAAASVASVAGATALPLTGNGITISGTNTITSFTQVPQAGAEGILFFSGACTLTHSATIKCPGGVNLTTAANTFCKWYSDGTAVWVTPLTMPSGQTITNALGGDVNLNNAANYFDGPSIAQGTVGTWWVSGQVTVLDSAGTAAFYAKLWDGTTVIAAGTTTETVNNPGSIALSGRITAPAGNLRISARDVSSTSGLIKFNQTGLSADSVITAVRLY